MRSTAEFRARVFAALGEWFTRGCDGPCPLHELREDEAAPGADTCSDAYDDGGLIK